MKKINLYLNIITCSLVVCIGLFLIAVSFFAGGMLGGLFVTTIGFIPIVTFSMDIYDNVKKFESET